jgi:hypothetical protein
MQAIEQADHRFPGDNAAFLDAVLSDVHEVTGMVYGVSTYQRLLRDAGSVIGVTRKPSNTTVQHAIDRARVDVMLPPAPAGTALDATVLIRAIEPTLQALLAPLHAKLELNAQESSVAPAASANDALQAAIAQASLSDARIRIQALQSENAQLRQSCAQAEARAEYAETIVRGMLEQILDAIAASAGGAQALTDAAARLVSTEQFLKRQNDAVRQQITSQADALRAENKRLRDANDHLAIEANTYRQAVVRQRSQGTTS